MARRTSAVIPSAFGVGLLFVTALFFRNTSSFLAIAHAAPGRVDGTGRLVHITFETPDGRKHGFATGWGPAFFSLKGQSVEVRYDPADPSHACLGGFFGLFWEWVPALIFGALGILCIGEGILRVSGTSRPQRAAPESEARGKAGEPWSSRPDWAQGRIESSTSLAGKWTFAIVWNFLTWPAAFLLWRQFTDDGQAPLPALRESWPILILLIFPLIFVVIAVVSLAQTLRRTYQAAWSGRSLFVMSAVPGVVGGSLEGVIHGRLRLRPDQGIRLTLRSHLRSTRRQIQKTIVTTSVNWKDDRAIPATEVTQAGDEALIPVHMTIPATCRETAERVALPDGRPGEHDSISWTLEARAEPRHSRRAEFEVPVFRTEAGAGRRPLEVEAPRSR